MKKLRILGITLLTVLLCMTLSACPITVGGEGNFNTFVKNTRPLANDLLNDINKAIQITEDDFIFNCYYSDKNIGVYYYVFDEYRLNVSKDSSEDFFTTKFQNHLSQGTLLQSDVDYLIENCKLNYALSFTISLGPIEAANLASYQIWSFKSNKDAKTFYNWEKGLAPEKNMVIDKNEIYYPDRNGSDFTDEITLERIKEIINEVKALIADN